MNNNRLWKFKRAKTKLTGLIPVKDLFVVIRRDSYGRKNCFIQLIDQKVSQLGFVTSKYQSISDGDIVEDIVDSFIKPTYYYQDPIDDNNGFLMAGINNLSMSQVLEMLGCPNQTYIHISKLKELEKRYNEMLSPDTGIQYKKID